MDCPRCAELEKELAGLRGQLAEAGRTSPVEESLIDNDRERELAKWLRTSRDPDAAAGFRAGWQRLGQLMSPRFRDWQRLWFEATGDGDRLRAQVGVLLREISRLNESG